MTTVATMERDWEAWPGLADLPHLDRPSGRLVVISAHPDDEVLGAGGLLASLDEDSPEPLFVAVTDGEASHPGSPAVRPEDLGAIRAAELIDGLHALGYQAPVVTRLRLPDSAVTEHVDELTYRVQRCVRGADLVLCPSSYDGHPDHVAVGNVVTDVCTELVPVWQFPIWIWHWTRPGLGNVPWGRASRFELAAEARRRKRQALACFRSQVAPVPGDDMATTVLPPEVLAHFTRPYEVYFT